MSNTIQNQQELQSEADKVISELNLRSVLKGYGNMRIVGSYDYGLMTWRDVDIDLITEQEPTDKDYWEIVKNIFLQKGVKNLTLADDRSSNEKDRPKSMYIGIKFKNNSGNIWKVDIRILSNKFVVTDKTANLIKKKLNEDTRKIILEIKFELHDNPNYHKGFFSTDIYEAVLLRKVKNLAEFKDYLGKIGRKF